MIDAKEFKYKSNYKGIDVYVEDFKPNSKAAWVIDSERHYGVVTESLFYIGKLNPSVEDEIDSIENYGYDLTAEFIEDGGCYFVALAEKLNWLVHVTVMYDNGLGGQYDEMTFLYYGSEDELREYSRQFGIEKWEEKSGDINFVKQRQIYYEPYTPLEFRDELPEQYLRVNRPDWVKQGNYYVEKGNLYHTFDTEKLPF